MKLQSSLITNLIPSHKLDPFGKEDLLMTCLPYYIPLITLIIYYEYLLFDRPWLAVFIMYSFFPFLDEVFKLDVVNPTEKQRKDLVKNDIHFLMCLYIPMIYDWVMLFRVLEYVENWEINGWNLFNFPAFFLIVSNIQGGMMVAAHQVYHKPGILNKALGIMTQSKNLYLHFIYEHLYGHHRNVATPEDAASAPKGITVYELVPKSFINSFTNVYKMQKQEEKKPWYLNYVVLSMAWNVVFVSFICYKYNIYVAIFFVGMVSLAIFFVQSINYLEHYGLRRKKLPNGQYEKVTIRHSWNAPHRITNYMFYKLQRHSDHHQNSTKPYQTLLSYDESPQLPHGYGLVLMTAFVPQVWFKIMDPLVDNYNTSDDKQERARITKKADYELKKYWIKLSILLFTFWFITLFK